MTKHRSSTLLKGGFIIIITCFLVLTGCSVIMESSSESEDILVFDDDPPLQNIPPSKELVGTIAFGDISGTLNMRLPDNEKSEMFTSKAVSDITGFMTYDGVTLEVTGSYDDEDGSIKATASGIINDQEIIFNISGTYDKDTGIFTGDITREIDDGNPEPGAVSSIATDGTIVVDLYLGNFGNDKTGENYRELGTWNLAIKDGEVAGTFWHHVDNYGGVMEGTQSDGVASLTVEGGYVAEGTAVGTIIGNVVAGTYIVADSLGHSAAGVWDGNRETAAISIISADLISGLATDSAGNIYISGAVENSASFNSGIIYSLSPDGNLRWSDLIGPNNGVLKAVAVDSSAEPAEEPADYSLYAIGYYEFTPGNKDWLIRKYENNWDKPVTARTFARIGGTGEDTAYDAAVDTAGNLYVVGVIENPASGKDWAIYSFDPDGNVRWFEQLGSGDGVLTGVAIDRSDDSVYVVGYFEFTPGNKDWLIRKYAKSGPPNVPDWGLSGIGGAGEDIAYDVAVDSKGNVIVVGVIDDNSSGKDWTTYSFSPKGKLNWSDQLGSKDGILTGVAVNPEDDSIYVTGYYTNFVGKSTGKDWLIRKYSKNGPPNEPDWRLPGFGGDGEDIANSVAMDPVNGRVYIGGFGTGITDGLSDKYAWLKCFDAENARELWDRKAVAGFSGPVQKYDLYLLMGQSNMVGRNTISADPDRVPHPRVFQLTRAREWVLAIDPLAHNDSGTIGVGPGLTFGKTMAAEYPEANIGLIPTARGGTSITQWERGDSLYEDAVNRALTAVANGEGTLRGIIWLQGESDSKNTPSANAYAGRLKKLVIDLREDLGVPDLPFVSGNIFEGLPPETHPYSSIVNAALTNLPFMVDNTHCVSSEGLTDRGDRVHFDSVSQREFGKRFAEATIYLQQKD